MSVGNPVMCIECGYLHGHHSSSCTRERTMNAKLGWDTAVAASERLAVENAQLRAENERLRAENERLRKT